MDRATTIRRVFAHVPETILALQNAEYMRPIAVGGQWTRIRVGILAAVRPWGTSNILDCPLFLGMGSSVGPGVGSPDTANFLGASCVGLAAPLSTRTLTYTAGAGFPYYSSTVGQAVWKYGQNYSVAGGVGSVNLPVAYSGNWERRCPLVVEITRPFGGNGVCTINAYTPAAGTGTIFDYRPADLWQCLENQGVPTIHGVALSAWINGTSLAASEAPGPLDSITIWWGSLFSVLEISAIGAAVLDTGIHTSRLTTGVISFAGWSDGTVTPSTPIPQAGYSGTLQGASLAPVVSYGFYGTFYSSGSYGNLAPLYGYAGTSGETSWTDFSMYGTGTITPSGGTLTSLWAGTNWSTYGTIRNW